MAAPDRGQTSTLTGVFAPGAPALFETLRTLVITPRRFVTPGETIRVEFAFSNLGGAAATGARVRFSLPPGVTYVEGSDRIDDAPLPPGESLVASSGAPLEDVEPNGQRRIAASYRVNAPIENGSELLFQAVLATDQTPLVASNAERLIVRSEPILANDSTVVTIASPASPKPGDVITIRATIANTGESSAHDVMAILPVPDHTRFVPRSARIAGRSLAPSDSEPFDYSSETIVAQRLSPGQSVVVEYQVTIDAPLPDGTTIGVRGTVASREVPEFPLESDEIAVTSPVNFHNDETRFVLHCDDVVAPGAQIPIELRVANAGTGGAFGVNAVFELPIGLVYTPGSLRLDGQPIADSTFVDSRFDIGTLPAGRIVELAFSAVVTLPGSGESTLPVSAVLQWSGGERRFSRQLRVRAASRFARARNYIEVDRSVVQAREELVFTAHVRNDGTAAERDARLRVLGGAFLAPLQISERGREPIEYAEPLSLGTIEPHEERLVEIRTTVVSPVPDRSAISLGAVLELPGGAFDLGSATVIARSRPLVTPERCNWEIIGSEPVRPSTSRELVIRFTNDGSDVLRDARMQLALPTELTIERTENARRDGTVLHFGDVAAHATHEARVTVRLVVPPRHERVLTLEGVLYGRGISPLEFPPLDVQTYAEPDFASAELRSNPLESINAGERVTYVLHMRNDGDGSAERLNARVVPSNLAVYVPSTTTLNGLPLPDDLGASVLWSQRGLMLTDVNPGVELSLRWEMVVMAPLPEDTAIETRAVIEWDGDRSIALAGPALRVVSAPSLEASSAGTPISVAGLLPRLEAPSSSEIVPPPPEPAAVEPSATPPVEPFLPASAAAPPAPSAPPEDALAVASAPAAPVPVAPSGPAAYLDLDAHRLARTIATLEKSDAGGLVSHLFALRLLFPDSLAGAPSGARDTLHEASHALRAPLDRFFVRLRVPRLTITAKDLEDRESRLGLRATVDAVLAAQAVTPVSRPTGTTRIVGVPELEALRSLAPALAAVPLGSVVPWIASAHLLGSAIEWDDGRDDATLAAYRSELAQVFSLLEHLPMPEFHRVLTSSVNRSLDRALAQVVEALRAAAHVAVE